MEDEILEFTYKKPERWIELSKTEIVNHRKLKATWSYEAAQDLRSQHNIQQHLSDKMLDEMLAEMDQQIISDLKCVS